MLPLKACHDTLRQRIAGPQKHDRDGLSLLLDRSRQPGSAGNQDIRFQFDQLIHEHPRLLGGLGVPPSIDPNIVALGPTQFGQPLLECIDKRPPDRIILIEAP